MPRFWRSGAISMSSSAIVPGRCSTRIVPTDLDAQGKVEAALALLLTVAADIDATGKLEAAILTAMTVAADIQDAVEVDIAALIQTIVTVAADIDATGELRAAAGSEGSTPARAPPSRRSAAGRWPPAPPCRSRAPADC